MVIIDSFIFVPMLSFSHLLSGKNLYLVRSNVRNGKAVENFEQREIYAAPIACGTLPVSASLPDAVSEFLLKFLRRFFSYARNIYC